MAEGFARAYGSDVAEAYSAGLAPANLIAEQTRKTMFEKNIDLGEQFPKDIRFARPELMDIVVNLSGLPLPPGDWKGVREWTVPDPIGKPDRIYREVRDQIESLVMALLLELRSPGAGPAPAVLRFGRPRTQP
jgi:protein-tyrosine-phosphatase